MLHKCANAVCPRLFRSLGRGKLFLFEPNHPATAALRRERINRGGRATQRRERYWLCDDCSLQLTLAFQPGKGMVAVPLISQTGRNPSMRLPAMSSALKTGGAEFKGAV
jgi:hypothetical protein